MLDREFVRTHGKGGQRIVAGRGGDGFGAAAGLGIRQRYLRGRDTCSRGISNGAGDNSAVALREGAERQRQNRQALQIVFMDFRPHSKR